MSEKAYVRKKYTLLIRKLAIQHDLLFASISKSNGAITNIKASSECLLNQQIPVVVYEDGSNDSNVQLHLLMRVANQDIQLGLIPFDVKKQKILKPLSKQFFSKQFSNKRGYIQYKFIAVENKTVNQSEITNQIQKKNDILFHIGQHTMDREEVESLMAIINQKDDVINKMGDQIQKLIKQTKKLNKSLSKQKSNAQQIQRNISLNVKLNQNLQTTNKNNKSITNLWEKQKDEYQYQIQKLSRKIRDLQNRQRQYKQQIQSLRKKIQVEGNYNQKRISDLRKQIEVRYDKQAKQANKQNRLISQSKSSQNDLQVQREKKNKYIQEQLAEQIKKIQAQKQKQLKKDFELELKLQLQKQNQREKQRQRQRQRERQRDKQIQRFKQKQKERQRSKNFLKESHADQHRELLKQMQQLDNDRLRLKQKLQIKDDELNNFVIKLERAQKQITKLEDQNIELRKTKSSLLRQVEGMSFKNQPEQIKSTLDNKPIFEYQKMILNERKQINDEKLKAEMEQLRLKIKRDEKQFKDKLEQKEMQLMKLRLSEKSANREKQIYSNRIKQIMSNVEGDRKTFLQALQNAHKFETQQTRAKQLEVQKNQLQLNNHKLTKQKQQLQNINKKLKSKIDQREGEWVILKSIEAQHDYYKTQCEKFEKANKKFEKQYEAVKEYCQNLEHIVGKKPRKTMDQDLNNEREQRYKTEIRTRLQSLMQQVSDMQNKFYLQQIQIWLTQRTNIIQYYAKKFEADKIRIVDMDNINEQAKNNLIKQKQKQINELKQQEIVDIDRKIAKLKLLVRTEQHKLVASMIDKAAVEQAIAELTNKISKLADHEQARKKQINDLKQKNTKLQTELKQRIAMQNFAEQNPQKRSISLFPDGDTSKIEDTRKSYLDQFKKSRDFYMNKPFEELKKINSELQAEKRRIQTEMNALRFNFDKQKVQLNDKIRTKQRQIKKLQHQNATSEKMTAKLNGDIEMLKKYKQDYDFSSKKLKQQLRQVSRTLQLKQKQCSEALSEIKRMQKNLLMYEQAQKQMFQDVKKMKQKLQKKQTEMETILDQRIQKSKLIDSQRIIQISRLEQTVKQLQQKLQRYITEGMTFKNENEKLSQLNTEYDVKLKQKQQENQAIRQQFDIFRREQIFKSEELQQQNNLLQHNLMQIAEEIAKKQQQCYQYQVKIQYAEKRQETLKTMKDDLQQECKQLKNEIQLLNKKLKLQYDEIVEHQKNMKTVKFKLDSYAEDVAKSQLKIEQQEKVNELQRQQIHELQKEAIRLEYEKKNLQTKIEFLNEKYNEQVKKLQTFASQKQLQIQRILSQKGGKPGVDDKSRKSSEVDMSPGSPSVRKLNTSIHKSTSLIQQPKSSKNISSSSLIRKSSSKQKQSEENDHIKYSKEGIQINFLRPVKQSADNLKGTLAIPNKQSAHQSSKVDIDVNQSDEQNPKRSNINNKNKQNQNGPQKPAMLSKQFDSQEQIDSPVQEGQRHEIQDRDYEAQIMQLQQRIQAMKIEMQEIIQERDGYLSQLKTWRNTYEKQSNAGSQILIRQHPADKIKENIANSSLEKSQQSDGLKKLELKKNPSFRSHFDISQDVDKSNVKKMQLFERQVEQLRSKVIEYEVAISENQNHIKQLEQGLANEQAGGQKLIAQIQDTMQKLEIEVNVNKKLREQMTHQEQDLCEKIVELEKKIQEMVIQEMRKDQTMKQTMKIIQQLNQQIVEKDSIAQNLQSQISKLKSTIDKSTKTINSNKYEYRKYEQQAQLQILRLKQTTDDLNALLTDKSNEVIQLTQRFVQLQQKLNEANEEIKKRQHMILIERSKVKDALERRDVVMDQMNKFDAIKSGLIDKVGDLQIRIGEKNEELKQLTKQTAITYKKYEIQLETEKQQHSLTRKKLKQRQQHITNLKMQLANYNDTCHDLQKQKNNLIGQLNKVEKQLRQIMKTYQAQLDELHKDKISLAKQVEKHQAVDKQNQLRIDVLNKQIAKKGRQIKELAFKIQDQQNNLQKLKQRHRKQTGDLIADIEIKNNQYHKIRVQLERQTEHYFSKQCEYLADREKKQKMETEYNSKLSTYEKTIKQMQQELKQIQNRPSIDQWQQVCFENQLFKNRIQQLQSMIRDNGEQHQQRIIGQFKRYKLGKQRQIQDLQSEMEKYRSKFHNLEETNYVLKKDNDSMKTQLRTVMQQKMKIQKTIKQYEQDLRQMKDQLSFYKAKRVDDLNKLLNQTYD